MRSRKVLKHLTPKSNAWIIVSFDRTERTMLRSSLWLSMSSYAYCMILSMVSFTSCSCSSHCDSSVGLRVNWCSKASWEGADCCICRMISVSKNKVFRYCRAFVGLLFAYSMLKSIVSIVGKYNVLPFLTDASKAFYWTSACTFASSFCSSLNSSISSPSSPSFFSSSSSSSSFASSMSPWDSAAPDFDL